MQVNQVPVRADPWQLKIRGLRIMVLHFRQPFPNEIQPPSLHDLILQAGQSLIELHSARTHEHAPHPPCTLFNTGETSCRMTSFIASTASESSLEIPDRIPDRTLQSIRSVQLPPNTI